LVIAEIIISKFAAKKANFFYKYKYCNRHKAYFSDFSVEVYTNIKKILRGYPENMGRNWVVTRYFFASP